MAKYKIITYSLFLLISIKFIFFSERPINSIVDLGSIIKNYALLITVLTLCICLLLNSPLFSFSDNKLNFFIQFFSSFFISVLISLGFLALKFVQSANKNDRQQINYLIIEKFNSRLSLFSENQRKNWIELIEWSSSSIKSKSDQIKVEVQGKLKTQNLFKTDQLKVSLFLVQKTEINEVNKYEEKYPIYDDSYHFENVVVSADGSFSLKALFRDIDFSHQTTGLFPYILISTDENLPQELFEHKKDISFEDLFPNFKNLSDPRIFDLSQKNLLKIAPSEIIFWLKTVGNRNQSEVHPSYTSKKLENLRIEPFSN